MDNAENDQNTYETKKKINKKTIYAAIGIIVVVVILATQITIFAIQPLGSFPEGVTIVMLRGQGTKLFDSADAMCMRMQDGVSFLCRAMAISAVAEEGSILLRLPYMRWAYILSTGGVEFVE